MKKPYRAMTVAAVMLTAGGIYAATTSAGAKARRRRKFAAKAMKNAGTVIDHISAFL